MPRNQFSAAPIGGRSGNGNIQDPSLLTTQQLQRESLWLRELIETRLDAMDKGIALLQAFADRTPTTMDVQAMVIALREVSMEKFSAIRTQIEERDERIETASRDVKAAVDAAFAAASERVAEMNRVNIVATGKAEGAFTKQVDNISDSVKNTTKGLEDKISDLKDRLTIIESRTSVSDPSTQIKLAEITEKVSRLSSGADMSSGRSAGMLSLWALVISAIGALSSVIIGVSILLKYAGKG